MEGTNNTTNATNVNSATELGPNGTENTKEIVHNMPDGISTVDKISNGNVVGSMEGRIDSDGDGDEYYGWDKTPTKSRSQDGEELHGLGGFKRIDSESSAGISNLVNTTTHTVSNIIDGNTVPHGITTSSAVGKDSDKLSQFLNDTRSDDRVNSASKAEDNQ